MLLAALIGAVGGYFGLSAPLSSPAERPSGVSARSGGPPPSVKHFWGLGGGDRYGLAWYDLSNGVGDPEPWARIYDVACHDRAGNMLVTDEETPAGPVERLKKTIKRL